MLLAVSFPPYGAFLALPLGMALLISAAERTTTPREAIKTGAACGLPYYGLTLYWFKNIFGPGVITLIAICLIFPAAFVLTFRFVRRRLPRFPVWLLAAIVWTGIEVYRSELFILRFGWMGLGYGLAARPLPAATAAWCGSYGLTFAVVVLAAALRAAVCSPKSSGLGAAVLLGSWTAFCVVPFPAPPALERPLRVRLVQADANRLSRMLALSRHRLPTGTDLILWPEYSLMADPMKRPDVWQRLTSVPRETGAHFVFGAKDERTAEKPGTFRNTAYVLAPSGALLGTHVKNHPVHLMDDGIPGQKADAIPTSLGRLGVAICFDLDFPDVARRLVQDGAEVLIVPNMDPAEWGKAQQAQHGLMFRMRAAECGRWLARADVAGGTSVCAPGGRETVRIPDAEEGILDVTVGRCTEMTPYCRGCWRFSQACLALFVALVCASAAVAVAERYRARAKASRAP